MDEHIVCDPNKRHGRPRINGTGITVHDIANDFNHGMTADEMIDAFDLTPGQVYAALSYYFDHKEQIDQENRERETWAEEHLQEQIRQGKAVSADDLRRRIEGRKADK